MKPNDENCTLPDSERPFRVLIIAGFDRRQYNCPGVDSKAPALMLFMAKRLPQGWEIDYEDLGNVYASIGSVRVDYCSDTRLSLRVAAIQPATDPLRHGEPQAKQFVLRW